MRKVIYWGLLFAFPLIGPPVKILTVDPIIAVAEHLVEDILQQGPTRPLKVVVLDITDYQRRVSYLAHRLTTHVTHQLINQGRWSVLERARMDQLLEEIAVLQSGAVADDEAARVGQLLGADAVLTGTLVQTPHGFVVDLRLIDMKGRILASASYTMPLSAQWVSENGRILSRLPSAKPKPVPHAEPPEPVPEPQVYLKPGNLLTNGDFRSPWEVGWKRYTQLVDPNKGFSHVSVKRCNSCQSNRAVLIRHSGRGNTYLVQIVRVLSPAVRFRAKAFLSEFSEGLRIIGFYGDRGFAAIALHYYNIENQHLGRTIFYVARKNPFYFLPGAPKPPQDKTTLHYVKLSAKQWEWIDVDVEREIRDFLPGVPVEQLAYIRVVLIAGAHDDNSGGELSASDIELRYKYPTR